MKNAKLILKKGNFEKETYDINKTKISLGASLDNDLVIKGDKFVSSNHASILYLESSFILEDKGSTNGTYVNKIKITRRELLPGDIIAIGDTEFEFSSPDLYKPEEVNKLSIVKKITIGRDPGSDIHLDNIQVSWLHATVTPADKEYFIEDNNSTNGIYLNGNKIIKEKIKKGDVIQICRFKLLFDGHEIKYFSEEGKVRLDALSLSKIVSEDKIILHDISLSIYPCEFVAIVGTSGAGKSTLMKALSGVSLADIGKVFINGISFYDNLDFFRLNLGYVPQDDIVHEELTVYKALYYSACLRLPEDLKKAEIDHLIDRILKELELEERKDTTIKSLSGGQRKRVSIGVELLTSPGLFFLDEPTSGLDPAIEAKMMALLKKLADQGRTVILVTHVTKNVSFCSKVIFLARGGYLVFFGSPDDALAYFNVKDFTEIYNKIESEGTPSEWAEKFRGSIYYKDCNLKRIKEINVLSESPSKPSKSNISGPSRGASPLRQLFILSTRYVEILRKDSKNLAIILLQAPIIAILLALVFKRNIFDEDPKIGDGNAALTLLFFLVCVSIWFGTSNAAREIIKERSIYERERMINLQVIPYVLSKFIILSIICFIQCAILFGIVSLGVDFPSDGKYIFYLDVYFCLVLTALTGVGMGLLISSVVSTVDKATSIVPILLIPQLIFSGAIIPLKNMDKISKLISYFAVSRWAMGLLGAIVNINSILPPHMYKLLKETFDINIRYYFNILSVLFILFIILTCYFQKRKDIKK